jgi:glycosylphosphatidylinositol transamidase (GPIT) subunit GPI8
MGRVFEEFSEIKFYLTNHDNEGFSGIENIEYITKNDLCERLQIV